MKQYLFKIDGPSLKAGTPLPLAISALDSFQRILDKTYLVGFGGKKISANERERFFLKATKFEQNSLTTYFEIAIQSVQLSLPIFTSLGPHNIWDFTVESFNFLKVVCDAVQQGEEPKYNFKDNDNVEVVAGNKTYNYNAPVIQIGESALPHYQKLAHLIDPKKLSEILAFPSQSTTPDMYLGKKDKEIFDIPTKIEKDTVEIKCEVFDFNKYKNAGKLAIKLNGQAIEQGEYNFTIFGNQDNVEYIYSMLKPEVELTCLREIALSPFGGYEIHKLHITGVSS